VSSTTAETMPQTGPKRSWMRGPLVLVGGLAAIACLAAVAGPYVHPVQSHDASVVVATRDLRFVDRADGGVGILDATDGSTVAVIPAGAENFVRATMRGLARARLQAGLSAEPPFRLTAWADDRLTLADTATGRTLELESFGQTNEADFARLLNLPGAAK